jgi:pectin methylesterase-like acyl-CoA thioesterase
VYRTFAQSDLAQINAAQNTFLSDPLSGSGISADRKLASGDLPFGTSVVVVDGLQYTTVQAAINALPSIGGAVLIPPGTYAGPTNIPSGTALIGIAASEGVGISTNSVILQYTTSLTLTNISNTRWENLWLDFSTAASAAGLELKAYNASGNAFCVQNQFRHVVINQAGGPSVPALKLSASGSGGTISNSFNKFDHLIIYGNSTTGSNPGPALSGIQLIGAGTPNAGPTVTQNSFNDVWVRGGLLAVWIAN